MTPINTAKTVEGVSMLHVILISVAIVLLIALLISGIKDMFFPHTTEEPPHSQLITKLAMFTVGGVIILLVATLPWIIASL